MHEHGLVHRDVHPTRLHWCNGKPVFNLIGLPYNFKKLLKGENFAEFMARTDRVSLSAKEKRKCEKLSCGKRGASAEKTPKSEIAA